MLHQDGSSHEWVAGQWWDLIVTMDDATSEVYSGFFVAEEGTMSTFRGLGEVIAENGLFCSLYADRASHYWHTPEAGGGVDKDNPTQVGRAFGNPPAREPENQTRARGAIASRDISDDGRQGCVRTGGQYGFGETNLRKKRTRQERAVAEHGAEKRKAPRIGRQGIGKNLRPRAERGGALGKRPHALFGALCIVGEGQRRGARE